jgi:hypothetical protein
MNSKASMIKKTLEYLMNDEDNQYCFDCGIKFYIIFYILK